MAALMVGAVAWKMPAIILHYHGAMYRKGMGADPAESLARVCNYAVDHHIDRATIIRVLGEPHLESIDWIAYRTGGIMGTIDADMTEKAKAVTGPACAVIWMRDGRAEGQVAEILSPDRCAAAVQALKKFRGEEAGK